MVSFVGGSSSSDVTVMKRLLKLELTPVLFVVVFTFTGESITSILSQNRSFCANIPSRFSNHNRFNLSVY